jgi:phytoene synthase
MRGPYGGLPPPVGSLSRSQVLDDLPPAQRLALAYAPARNRSATLALLALDARLGAILRGRREPIATQLRLAWWRDVLARPVAEWPCGEPVLDGLRGWRDPSCLAGLPGGWEALLSEELTPAAIAEFADGRGQAFACLSRELGAGSPEDAATAARAWALADLAANLSGGLERALVVECGRALPPPPHLPASLRPLAVLAALGTAALERGGGPLLAGPRSALLALRIGIAGR